MNEHKKQSVAIFYLLALFIVLFVLNVLMPLYSDDWVYSFIYRTNHRVETLGDIFHSQYRHYFLWGGRSVAHVIAQFLLLINKSVADFLNAAIYIVMVYLIYVIAKNSFKPRALILLSIITSLLILFLPDFMETVLFKTVSSNYLWTSVIILLFLLPYVLNVYKEGSQKSTSIVMLLSGIIAGWTNENTGFGLVIGTILFLILYKRKYSHIPTWAICGAIGVVIGFSFMVLAPGNELRMNKGYLDNPNFSYITFYLIRAKTLVRIYMSYIFPMTFIYILFFAIYRLIDKAKNKKAEYLSIIFFVMGQISVFVMIGSPIFPYRAAFGAIVLLIISMVILVGNIHMKSAIRNVFLTLCVFLIITSIYKYFIVIEETCLLNSIMKKREKIVNEAIDNNNLDVVLPKEFFYFQTFAYPDLSPDSTFWLNRDYAKYRNLKTIRVE